MCRPRSCSSPVHTKVSAVISSPSLDRLRRPISADLFAGLVSNRLGAGLLENRMEPLSEREGGAANHDIDVSGSLRRVLTKFPPAAAMPVAPVTTVDRLIAVLL